MRIGRFRKTESTSVGLSPKGIEPAPSRLLHASCRQRRGKTLSRIRAFVPPLCLLLLVSCGGAAPRGDASLRKAAERYWDSRLARDYDAIWERSLSREAREPYGSKEAFVRTKGNTAYHWYEVEEIRVDGDVGQVTVRYTWNHDPDKYPDFANRDPIEDTLVDEWTLENGQWRLRPRSLDPLGRR